MKRITISVPDDVNEAAVERAKDHSRRSVSAVIVEALRQAWELDGSSQPRRRREQKEVVPRAPPRKKKPKTLWQE